MRPDRNCRKVAEIDQQIETLSSLRRALGDLTRACERGSAELPCPIIEAFSSAETRVKKKKSRAK